MHLRLIPDPVLRQLCETVTVFDTVLAKSAHDMLDVMYQAKGRGLAAPQVGLSQRLFVMDADWKTGVPTPCVFVNPQIMDSSATTVVNEEACLSIPNQTSHVARPDRITLQWQGLDGAFQRADFDGFHAVCIQHERDHLDGVLCIDHPEAV